MVVNLIFLYLNYLVDPRSSIKIIWIMQTRERAANLNVNKKY